MKRLTQKSILNKTVFLLFAVLFISCSKSFIETRPITEFSSLQSHLLKRQDFLFTHNFKIKFKTSVNIDGKENRLNGRIVTNTDSLISINLISSALGIEVAQIHFTKDSLFLLNKIEKTCFSGSYNDVAKYSYIDYHTVYCLLTNSYSGYQSNSLNSDNCNYLSNLQRFIINEKTDSANLQNFITTYLDNKGNLERTERKSYKGDFLRINYSNFALDYAFPKELHFTTYVKREKFEMTFLIESISTIKNAEYQNFKPLMKNYKPIEL